MLSKIPLSRYGISIWLIAAVFFMYEFFLRTFVGALAPQIIQALSINTEQFAIITSAYFISYGIMQIPVGILTDKYGVRIIMTAACLLCAIATICFAFSHNIISAYLCRLFIGAGSAFAFVGLLIIVATWFPEAYFGTFAGASQFIGTMGPLLAGGPFIILLQEAHANWRDATISVGIFGLMLSLIIAIFVKNKPRQGQQAMIFLNIPTPITQRLKRLFSNKQAWYIALYSCTIYTPITVLGAVFGTQYLELLGFNQDIAADLISLVWLGYAVGCPLLGLISDTVKRRKPLLIIAAIIGFCDTLILICYPMQHTSLYIVLFIVLGIATSSQNLSFAAIIEMVEKNSQATALGFNNGTISLMTTITPIISGYIIQHCARHPKQITLHDFSMGLTVMPFLYLFACLIALCIRETFCKPQQQLLILHPVNKHK